MEKNSGEESKLVSERLDENKKAEKTAIMREEERKRRKRKKKGDKEEEKDANDEKLKAEMKDEKIGRMIDVKR